VCGDHDRVRHRVVLLERADHLRDRRLLLADGVVDADDVLSALVDDGVHGDRGLAGLPVADDQLALAAADRHHAVDRLETRLQRLLHRLAVDDAGGEALDRQELLARRSGPLPSIGCPSAFTTRPSICSPTGTEMMRPVRLTVSPSLISREVAEHTAPTLSSSRFSAIPKIAVRELEHLAGHGAVHAMDPRDPVADRNHRAHLRDVHVDSMAPDLVADDLGDFFCPDIHLCPRR
jgi:hypothetical protein